MPSSAVTRCGASVAVNQARTRDSSGVASARALAQASAQPGAGFWQLASSAGQAASTLSSAQPGRSVQAAGCQSAASRRIGGGPSGAVSTAAAPGAGLLPVPGAAGVLLAGGAGCDPRGSGSGVLQAASAAAMIAASIRPHRTDPMALILLEALGALVLFVFIVWWTMFAGRKRGERRDDETPRD